MKRMIEDPQYPWFEKLDEESPAEMLRAQEFNRQSAQAYAVIKKYKEENGWDHPSIGSRFDQLTTVHRMGREQFYSRQRDLAAIKRYKAALKQIEIPDFSFKLSQKLKSHFRIEAAEYIRNQASRGTMGQALLRLGASSMSEETFTFDVDAALRRVLAAKKGEPVGRYPSQLSQPLATVAAAKRTPSLTEIYDKDTHDNNGLNKRDAPGAVGSSDQSWVSQLSRTPIQVYISAVLDEEEICDFHYYAGGFEYDDGICRAAAEHRALERIFLRRGEDKL